MTNTPKPVSVKRHKISRECVDVTTDLGHHCRVCWDTERMELDIDYDGLLMRYNWSVIGDKTFTKFLFRLNFDYLGQKMLGDRFHVFDVRKTVEAINEDFHLAAEEGNWPDYQVAEEHDNIANLQGRAISWDTYLSETNMPMAYQYMRSSINEQWINFWQAIWLPVVRPALERPQQNLQLIDGEIHYAGA